MRNLVLIGVCLLIGCNAELETQNELFNTKKQLVKLAQAKRDSDQRSADYQRLVEEKNAAIAKLKSEITTIEKEQEARLSNSERVVEQLATIEKALAIGIDQATLIKELEKQFQISVNDPTAFSIGGVNVITRNQTGKQLNAIIVLAPYAKIEVLTEIAGVLLRLVKPDVKISQAKRWWIKAISQTDEIYSSAWILGDVRFEFMDVSLQGSGELCLLQVSNPLSNEEVYRITRKGQQSNSK